MKKLINAINHRILWVSTFLFVQITTKTAVAQDNPFDIGSLLPASQKDKSMWEQFLYVMGMGLRMMIIGAMAVGIGYMLFGIYQSFNAARERDNWAGFITTTIFSIIGIVIAVVIAGVAWKWGVVIDSLGQ